MRRRFFNDLRLGPAIGFWRDPRREPAKGQLPMRRLRKIGSTWGVLLDQPISWCCIDRLSWYELSILRGLSSRHPRVATLRQRDLLRVFEFRFGHVQIRQTLEDAVHLGNGGDDGAS